MTQGYKYPEARQRFWARKFVEASESDGIKVVDFCELAGIPREGLTRWVRKYEGGYEPTWWRGSLKGWKVT